MIEDYSQRFARPDAVAEYRCLYSDDARNYANVLYQVERKVLDDLLEPMSTQGQSYLDFATGTGRIITYLEGRFASSTGIDISGEMIAVCEESVKKSSLRCEDVTATSAAEQYDVVTAFRFFLNAGPQLGADVIDALVLRIAPNGRLIVNNHGRLMSMNIFGAAKRFLGWRSKQAVMSDRNFERLFLARGFAVRRRICYGVIGGRLGKVLGYEWVLRLEHRLLGGWLAGMFGTCAIYEFER